MSAVLLFPTILIDASAAAEASSVTKASPGYLYGFEITNNNVAGRYIQFYNTTSVPAEAQVPGIASIFVAAGATVSRWWPQGILASVGICWANSTTLATKTIGAADSFGHVYYL